MNFCDDWDAPPRAIRPAVMARHLCGGSRTWNGARIQQNLTSVLKTGSAQETVKACPFIGFGLERFCPGALGCQRWSPGPQCFRAEGPCLMAAFRILQTTGN